MPTTRDLAVVLSSIFFMEENADGFHVNSYFLTHPEMVLGTPASRSTPYGKPEYTVLPLPDADLGEQLHEAVSHIHGQQRGI